MSAIIEDNVPFPVIACNDCKHYDYEKSYCPAFGGLKDIPKKIWNGDLHLKPLPGQKNDIVFEPVKNPRWMTPEYIKKHQ